MQLLYAIIICDHGGLEVRFLSWAFASFLASQQPAARKVDQI